MNKAERHRIKMKHFKRRKKNIGFLEDNYTFRQSGKPCSCFLCSKPRYERHKIKHDDYRNL